MPNGAGTSTFVSLILSPVLLDLALVNHAPAAGYFVAVHALLVPVEISIQWVAALVESGGPADPLALITHIEQDIIFVQLALVTGATGQRASASSATEAGAHRRNC